jgi:hypothetical protein
LKSFRMNGEPGGARTRDHRIKSAMLYQLSYRLLGVMKNWKAATRLYRQVSIGLPAIRSSPVFPSTRLHTFKTDFYSSSGLASPLRHGVELLLLIGIENGVKFPKSLRPDRCQLRSERRLLLGKLIDRGVDSAGLRGLSQLFPELLHLLPDWPGLLPRILKNLPGLCLLIRGQVQLLQTPGVAMRTFSVQTWLGWCWRRRLRVEARGTEGSRDDRRADNRLRFGKVLHT